MIQTRSQNHLTNKELSEASGISLRTIERAAKKMKEGQNLE